MRLNISRTNSHDTGFLDVDIAVAKGKILPYEDNSVSAILSQGLLDTITQPEGVHFFKECRRILKDDGTLTIQTLDLDKILKLYNNNSLPSNKPWLRSRGEMLNNFLRNEERQWTYNFDDISRLGQFTGFESAEIVSGRCDVNAIAKSTEYDKKHTLTVCLKKCMPLKIEQKPLVSILFAAYNPEFFENALVGALNQTYENIEIIVCDYSSSEDIKDILQEFNSDPRITYTKNGEKLGEHLNYERSLELSKGRYVKFFNDTDILEPRCVEILLNQFLVDSSITVATSYRTKIDEQGAVLPDDIATIPILTESSTIEGTSAANLLLRGRINYIGELSTVMVRKDHLQSIKPHYSDFAGNKADEASEIAMYLNLLSKGNLAYVAEHLSYVRDYSKQHQTTPDIDQAELKTWEIFAVNARRLGFLHQNHAQAILYKPQKQNSWLSLSYSDEGTDGKETVDDQEHHTFDPGVTNFNDWKNKTELRESDFNYFSSVIEQQSTLKKFHFIMSVTRGQEEHLADTIDAIGTQVYQYWHLSVVADFPCPDPVFDEFEQLQWVEKSNNDDILFSSLKNTASDWTIFLPVGSIPERSFLYFLYRYSLNNSSWKFMYTDEAILDESRQVISTMFKPDCNLEMLRSKDYLGNGCAVKTASLIELYQQESFKITSNFETLLRTYDTFGPNSIGHIPTLLFNTPDNSQQKADDKNNDNLIALEKHFERNKIECTINEGLVPNSRFIEYSHTQQPLISIIIPTKNNVVLLQRCIQSIYEKTDYPNFQIIIVDNNSNSPETISYLKTIAVSQLNLTVLPYTKPFNYSAINNYAVNKAASGDYLLFLNDDTEILQPNWLTRMAQLAQNKNSGAVGARLVYKNKKIQHAGVVMGMYGLAHHPGIDEELSETGYMNRYQLVQNFSAVTAACMLVKKSKFIEVGGFDDKQLKVLFNDVDLCLKLTTAGYQNIWTPHVTLIHHGSTSLKKKKSKKELIKSSKRADNERNVMLRRWRTPITKDPCYNRNLSLDYFDYRLDASYSVPWDPEIIDRPKILALKNNSGGSSHYRVTAPLEKLRDECLIWHHTLPDATTANFFLPSATQIQRTAADSFLLHSIFPNSLYSFKKWKLHTNSALIYGLDDLVTHLPRYNPRHNLMPENINIPNQLKQILSFCDRLVVTTEPLQDYCLNKRFIKDIVIVPNCLDGNLWLKYRSQKLVDSKPRIGWAGAAQHHGDLELIVDLVKETYKDVNWIFMGMCPEDIKNHIHEFHPAVDFDHYPEKLASLNLDLALAPLEMNRFNEAKSNLRLLEYGIFGIPVVATDIFPYQNTPAITVKNDHKEWKSVVMELAADPQTRNNLGKKMKQWVQDNYLLEYNLDQWSSALTL